MHARYICTVGLLAQYKPIKTEVMNLVDQRFLPLHHFASFYANVCLAN